MAERPPLSPLATGTPPNSALKGDTPMPSPTSSLGSDIRDAGHGGDDMMDPAPIIKPQGERTGTDNLGIMITNLPLRSSGKDKL